MKTEPVTAVSAETPTAGTLAAAFSHLFSSKMFLSTRDRETAVLSKHDRRTRERRQTPIDVLSPVRDTAAFVARSSNIVRDCKSSRELETTAAEFVREVVKRRGRE